MTIVLLQISLHGEKRVEHLTRNSSDPHEMSLIIEVKTIRPVNFSGVTLNLDKHFSPSVQKTNVVNPWKIFHWN